MPSNLGDSLGDLEARIHRLEQRAPAVELPMAKVTTDTVDGNPVAAVSEPLDYSVGAWESYPKLTATVDGTTGLPGGTWSDGPDGLLPPRASRMGSMIFLNGLIKRTTGVINANVNNANIPLFRLPQGWRPARTVLLICPCASASVVGPEATVTMGSAMLIVNPDPSAASGLVRLVTTTVQITAGATGGWLSLQGAFPAVFT